MKVGSLVKYYVESWESIGVIVAIEEVYRPEYDMDEGNVVKYRVEWSKATHPVVKKRLYYSEATLVKVA